MVKVRVLPGSAVGVISASVRAEQVAALARQTANKTRGVFMVDAGTLGRSRRQANQNLTPPSRPFPTSQSQRVCASQPGVGTTPGTRRHGIRTLKAFRRGILDSRIGCLLVGHRCCTSHSGLKRFVAGVRNPFGIGDCENYKRHKLHRFLLAGCGPPATREAGVKSARLRCGS